MSCDKGVVEGWISVLADSCKIKTVFAKLVVKWALN